MRQYRSGGECPNCQYPGGGLIVEWEAEGVAMNGCNRCGYRAPASEFVSPDQQSDAGEGK